MKKGSRKEKCKWGHEGWVLVGSYRRCGVCHRERMRGYRVRVRLVEALAEPNMREYLRAQRVQDQGA